MDHLTENVKESVKGCKSIVNMHVADLAEKYAEVYVSSTLGLVDGEDSQKQSIKNQYIEAFYEEMRKSI
jgi:hypothetical protein